MQNFNYFLVVCAVAASVCVIPTSHAQDTEAQSKAREALRQKVTQLDGSAPAPLDTEAQAKARDELRKKLYEAQPTGSRPVISQPAATVSRPVTAQPAVAAPVTTQPDGSAPTLQDTPAQAKAREELRKKLNEAQPASSQPVVSQPAAPQPSAAAPVTITMTPAVTAADAQAIEKARQAVREKLGEPDRVATDSPEVAKAREAVRQKLGDTTQPAAVGDYWAQPPMAGQSADKAAHAQTEAQRKAEKAAQIEADKFEAAAQAERRTKRNANLAPAAFQPIQSPALPISNDKQQRLADLLQKYRADQITPEQYHLERAKILGEQ